MDAPAAPTGPLRRQEEAMSRLESDYYSHMGFDPEHTREVLSFYVPFFEEAGGRVLELAPGRGEFLGLLREHGIAGAGVDVDEGMVEAAVADGLDVVAGDAIEYLHSVAEPGSFAGVFSAHFLEHLHPETVERMLAGVRRVLAPGGRFVSATPNPACYSVLSHDFWRDPTHVRFYDLPLLEFLCAKAGLEVEKSGTNPSNHPGPPPETQSPQVTVRPGLDDVINAAVTRIAGSLAHGTPERGPEGHDPSWAYQLAHVVKTLSERLTATQEELRDLRTAHAQLLATMYQGNEIYVVARAPLTEIDATSDEDVSLSS
jgi:SAM-dependent methyltransferase